MEWISVDTRLPPAFERVAAVIEGNLTGLHDHERDWLDAMVIHDRWFALSPQLELIENGSRKVTHWARVNLPPRSEGE